MTILVSRKDLLPGNEMRKALFSHIVGEKASSANPQGSLRVFHLILSLNFIVKSLTCRTQRMGKENPHSSYRKIEFSIKV